MNVLGLDPATATGWAHNCGRFGTWHLGGPAIPGRQLWELYHHMRDLYLEHPFDVIACEEASFGAGASQMRTMQFHNRLRGVVEMAANKLGASILWYAPATLKKWATGSGKATKEQVMRAVETQWRVVPADDNQADAIVLMYMGIQGVPPVGSAKAAKKVVKARRKKAPRLFPR